MASNIGFDDGNPYAENGADEGVVFEDGARFAVALKGEETRPPLTVHVNGGVTVEPGAASLIPFPDMNPVPRVLIDVPVSAFPSGSVTVSLQSTVEGRTIDVRGGVRKPASSPLIVLDPEPGLMVPTSYTVLGYDAAGNVVGSWPLGSTIVEFDGVVIQQPLDPRLSVQVKRLRTTAAEITRMTPGEPAYPQGRSLPGIVGLGPRRGVEELALDLFTATHADADKLQATLGDYNTPQLPIWLMRTPPGMRIPRRLFCHVPSLTEININGHIGMEYVQHSAVVTEIKPPAASISAAVLTYSDIAVFYETYSALGAVYATYSDIARDTSLVGAAG